MKLYALLIYDSNKQLLFSNYNLDDIFFLYRFAVKNTIESITQNAIQNIQKNNTYKITDTIDNIEVNIYGYCYDKYFIIIASKDYSMNLAYELFRDLKITKNYENVWNKHQDDKYIDKIKLIQNELDDTKIIIIESIDKLLERGIKLDELVEKSNNLNEQTFLFKKKSQDLNSCCIIL